MPCSTLDAVHPLAGLDGPIVARLVATAVPRDDDLIDAARLLLRYQGFPGAQALQRDLAACLQRWGLNQTQLQARTRALWDSGYRPPLPSTAAQEPAAAVGSGADVGAD